MTAKKKTARKPRAKKTTEKPQELQQPEGNVEPIGPQYHLSAEERTRWKTIKAKVELATEKRELANAQDEMASMLQQQWIEDITKRLSLQNKEFTVNGDRGVVQVTGDMKKKGKG